jgi:hypothetical protein
MKKSSQGTHRKRSAAPEPRLGIFWLVKDKLLLIESAPLSECEKYADHLNYPGSHIDVWERWRQVGKATGESEYEEFPRGRAMYSTSTKSFTLLADRCILKRKDLIATIKDELHLPKRTTLGTDPHYRCSTCLYGNAEDED